jgi:hypothetical protein
MRRFARPLLYLGTILIVVGLGRYHAQYIGHYYFHSAQRLPWNLTYAGLLCLAAYGVGLPDLDRRRSAWGPAATAALIGAVCVSLVQRSWGRPSYPVSWSSREEPLWCRGSPRASGSRTSAGIAKKTTTG